MATIRMGGVPMRVSTPPIELAKARGIINLEGLMPALLHMAKMMGSSRATDFGPDGDAWGLSEGVFSLPWSTTTEQVR